MSHNALEIDEDGEGRKKTLSKKDYDSIGSRGKLGSAGSSMQGVEGSKAKFELPPSCKMQMQKLNRIEKLDEDYVLVAHPYP